MSMSHQQPGTSRESDLQAPEVGFSHAESQSKQRMAGPTPEFLIQWVKERGLRFCIHEFPGDADAVGLGAPL